MSRILICWELGGNLGHVMRLLPLARILRVQGHAIVWAFSKTHSVAWQLVTAEGFVCHSVERENTPPISSVLSLSYGQNLLKNGYSHGDNLKNQLLIWRSLFLSAKPDMIIAEHAPTALIAARSMNIPRAVTGTGFTIPPLSTPMPSLHPWLNIPRHTLAEKEAEFLAAVNPALESSGHSFLTSAADIFTGAELFLCTWPEFDHYSDRKEPFYFGPITESVAGIFADWPSSGRDNIFAYIGFQNRNLLSLLAALGKLGLPVYAVIPGLSKDDIQALSSPSIRITDSPVSLEDVSNHCCLAITEAGHNTTSQLLLNAVPILLFPSQLEQQLLAYRLASQHLCSMVSIFDTTPDMESKIRGLINDNSLHKNIGALAQKYAASDNSQRIRIIAGKCIAILER
jgi:UDP:flavonoid glycosyltransferase YjiC (YdhE family)